MIAHHVWVCPVFPTYWLCCCIWWLFRPLWTESHFGQTVVTVLHTAHVTATAYTRLREQICFTHHLRVKPVTNPWSSLFPTTNSWSLLFSTTNQWSTMFPMINHWSPLVPQPISDQFPTTNHWSTPLSLITIASSPFWIFTIVPIVVDFGFAHTCTHTYSSFFLIDQKRNMHR